jgi:hypothetical protein
MNLTTHVAPDEEDLKKNIIVEPLGERLRAELTEWLDKNKIVSIFLDTPNHRVMVDIVKLPPRIKSVLKIWGSIFVEDRE